VEKWGYLFEASQLHQWLGALKKHLRELKDKSPNGFAAEIDGTPTLLQTNRANVADQMLKDSSAYWLKNRVPKIEAAKQGTKQDKEDFAQNCIDLMDLLQALHKANVANDILVSASKMAEAGQNLRRYVEL